MRKDGKRRVDPRISFAMPIENEHQSLLSGYGVSRSLVTVGIIVKCNRTDENSCRTAEPVKSRRICRYGETIHLAFRVPYPNSNGSAADRLSHINFLIRLLQL